MNREIWLKPFTYDAVPFPCPTCGEGRLRHEIQTRGGEKHYPLFHATSAENHRRNMRSHGGVLDGPFTYMAVCDREECRGPVAMCGELEYRADKDELGRPKNLRLILKPKFICPPPNIFSIPGGCPDGLRSEVQAAFRLFWCDPGACANRIRNAVELVLTDMGVARFGRPKGKRRRLSLHDRIVRLERAKPETAKALMAMKWLGNAGSHPAGVLTREDALDGFEILEHVMQERYLQRGKAISKLSREIIRRKGPRLRSERNGGA